MEKYGTPAALPAREYIVIKYDQTVISAIFAQQFFVACDARQAHRAIVKSVTRRIAPALLPADPASRQVAAGARDLVVSCQHLQHAKPANGGFAITLALVIGQSVATQQTRKTAGTDDDLSAAGGQ